MIEIHITIIRDSPRPGRVIATSVTLTQSPRPQPVEESGPTSTVRLSPEEALVLREILAVLPIKEPPG